ncbi:MAG: cytochrome c oxidase subunit 3 [Candidatus Thalassarchaeaceae archaeon]|jgi:cytochrome c oxidase subunit 3|nr:cytochrome c oxidase subunit 3 [Candidatus Thalassarchaeaceae archaeon]
MNSMTGLSVDDSARSNGEVHNSLAPLIVALATTLCLGALLIWPLAIIGIPMLIFGIKTWVSEEVHLWPHREERSEFKTWGDASWGMLWIIVTESIVFSAFFAYWFWTRWHTVNWSGAVGGTWPASGVEHDLLLVGMNTIILLTSGITAHRALESHLKDERDSVMKYLVVTLLLGAVFLAIQAYEYLHTGFLWNDHPYGTAFFALTGLHGLHVLVGLVMLAVVLFLTKTGRFTRARHDSFRAITNYWHFVDAVWVILFLIVYLEVI